MPSFKVIRLTGKCFRDSADPSGQHFDVYLCMTTEAKVQSGVSARVVATLTQHALFLGFSPVANEDPCTYCASIRPYAFQFNLYPVLFTAEIVA
jgi:hypothetical protein